MTRVVFCQLAASSFKMSDTKVVSVMYEQGANEVQGFSTVILWETNVPSFLSSRKPLHPCTTLLHPSTS